VDEAWEGGLADIVDGDAYGEAVSESGKFAALR
jgi:hypothetical protein